MSKILKYVSIVFFILGMIAFISGDKRKIDLDELTLTFLDFDDLIKSDVTKQSSIELADYLMKQEHHYNLIDLTLNDYKIPTSERMTIDSLLAKNIPVNETIILYSESDTDALKAYFLLQIRGYFKVSILSGGLNIWKSDVLFPVLNHLDEAKRTDRNKLTDFFGGVVNSRATKKKLKEISFAKKHKIHKGC